MRVYEDVEVGEAAELGEYRITKSEIVEFGETYDPQPIHTDEAAARESPFGGLIASGWQTAAICMRVIVDGESEFGALAGVGVDDLRWHAPLTPGDRLRVSREFVDKRPSESRDDRGFVTTHVEGHNQDGELVISYDATAMVPRRSDT